MDSHNYNTVFPMQVVLSSRERNRLNALVISYDLPYPASIPASQEKQKIDLGERILEAAIREEGHHTALRDKTATWAEDIRGTEQEEHRATIFSLGPSELNFGRFDGDALEKANAIIAWATAEYGETWVDYRRGEQLRDVRDAWRDAIEAAHERAEARRFRKSPPDEYNGWERVEADHDGVELAYQGSNHGKPSVAAVFEDQDGELQAQEFLVEHWEEANGDPRDARHNRPIRLYSNEKSVWDDLKRHLSTFDAEPLSVDERAAAPA